MELDKELYQEIKEYCTLNNLKPREYITKLLRDAFNRDKYGDKPAIFKPKKEKIIEIPIEKEQNTTSEKEIKETILKNEKEDSLEVAEKVEKEEEVVYSQKETENNKSVHLLKTKKRKL